MRSIAGERPDSISISFFAVHKPVHLIVFPNCKINLGLRIIRKRPDGFHDLQTIFYPLPLHDILEIIKDNTSGKRTDIAFSVSGLEIQGKPEDNLCVQAFSLLKKDFPTLPPPAIHLHKKIPTGSGLGGGSSDAAFTLMLLNDLYHLQLSREHLVQYALTLGSDCPFFIMNEPCYAQSRGESLETIDLDLSAYTIVLVYPGIHISTAWAFSTLHPLEREKHLQDLIGLPVEQWKAVLENDFEKPVFEIYGELKEARDRLYQQGALYAGLSGSGSTLFAIFSSKPDELKGFPVHYGFTFI